MGNDDQIAGNHAEVSHDIAEQVLIAEIGGGPRWKQVNFPVSIFQDFFGAQRGNNEYVIELMNIAKDGTLGDVEKDKPLQSRVITSVLRLNVLRLVENIQVTTIVRSGCL